MNDGVDLRRWLEAWPYDEGRNARMAKGDDGRDILQIRTALGIEQLELEGRPDALRPRGRESLLEHQRARLAQAKAAGREAAFRLTAEECRDLFAEGTLYYFRYVHLFQLRDWARTARDTTRNLGLFDFVHRHAYREEDRQHLEKWRPYILRMNAIARAMIDFEADRHEAALAILTDASRLIQSLKELEEPTFQFERARSLSALQEVAERVRQMRPVPELERLEQALQRAIESQAFERAAELRDRIRVLRHQAEGKTR